jgi:hypothetical protein
VYFVVRSTVVSFGVFSIPGLSRCVEALTRAGEYDKTMLLKAISMFEVSPSITISCGTPLDTLPRISCCTSIMSGYAPKKFRMPVKGTTFFCLLWMLNLMAACSLGNAVQGFTYASHAPD